MRLTLIFLLLVSSLCSAAEKDSHNLLVNQISVWGGTGHLLVQTIPRHAIDGLDCESDYWLKLSKDSEGYQPLLTMLLAAQMSQSKISIRAVDDAGSDFCRLERVITYK